MLRHIQITDTEHRNAALTPQHLDEALQAIRRDGFTTLTNAADVNQIDTLYAQMLRDIDSWNATAEEKITKGNFTPSRRIEHLFPDILMNPFVAEILGVLLGREVICGMYSSNITLPGLGDQQLHVDMAPHSEDADLSGPCTSVVVNFPLVDFTIENGATELWPGTHHVKRLPGETYVADSLRDLRRKVEPPVRAELPRGGVLIRDIRLWHRGTTNHHDYIRPMIAMICNGGYRPGVDESEKIPTVGAFPREARSFFETSPRLQYRPEYTDQEIVHSPGHKPALR